MTGIYCGSDGNCLFNFNKAIGTGNLGELHNSDEGKVWFTKTNHPIDTRTSEFNAQRVVCVVRNPMDTIKTSSDIKNLFGCESSLEVASDYSDEKFAEWWKKWVIIQS